MKLSRRPAALAALLAYTGPFTTLIHPPIGRRALAYTGPFTVDVVADGGRLTMAEADAAAAELLALIPTMSKGAPATNATIAPSLAAQIEEATAALEARFGAHDLAVATNLNGSWRLLYSNGREITSLAAGLPGGFALGPTYQPLDSSTGRFENQGSVLGPFAKLSTTVIGDVRVAPAGSANNRVDVEFRRIVFSLDELFGRPVRLRKVLKTALQPGVEPPANDQTFLSANVRVVRGGDGALFIFRREESSRPLLSVAEREALYRDGGAVDVTTGTGRPEDSAPPELKFLLRDPKL
ncbi:pap fibrillin [Chrysochromulina tobinii]|uniref:Pap fibrillin n=1 Tax=Chrysochromulina tobinii TaxID=1460289 RepID=A0A0M0K2L3_9EUKA|nr:pap fibrillin [Chrysochromulina tobinii]|eukprot:KOO33111.1 pap fibrillin [Chrysochromulina sp. CCMP291]